MKPEEQRIAIAESCGWKLHERHAGKDIPLHLQCWTNGKDECFGNYLPDYLNDLNACHEMEKRLPVIKVSRYISEMWAAMCRDCKADEIAIGTIHATAAQRCEAFLRTLNLWRDSNAHSIGKWTEEKC